MTRFIILLAVGYLFYRALKSWMSPNTSASRAVSGASSRDIDDVMIKDPFCESYFAKRNGVHLRVDGEDLYFCSTQCRDQYIAANSEGKG